MSATGYNHELLPGYVADEHLNRTTASADSQRPFFTDSVQLRTDAGIACSEAQIAYNDDAKTADIGSADGVCLQANQEQARRVVNKTGSELDNGFAGYVSGAQGNRPTIAYAKADTLATAKIAGLLTQDIVDNAEGFVTSSGLVRGIDTTGATFGETWILGQTLYLSAATAGYLTKTAPVAPNVTVVVGIVSVLHATQGEIDVNIVIYPTIKELSDVDGVPLTANGQILVWDEDNKVWNATTEIKVVDNELSTATKDLSINCATGKTAVLDKTVWKDINIGGVGLTGGASNKPDFLQVNDPSLTGQKIYTYFFDGTKTEELYGGFEIQHDYKEGTTLKPHIHFITPVAGGAGDVVRWVFDYYIKEDGITHSGTSTIDVDVSSNGAFEEIRASFADIVGTNIKIGHQFFLRIERAGTASQDTYSSDVFIGTIGIHYEVDTIGSRQIGSK